MVRTSITGRSTNFVGLPSNGRFEKLCPEKGRIWRGQLPKGGNLSRRTVHWLDHVQTPGVKTGPFKAVLKRKTRPPQLYLLYLSAVLVGHFRSCNISTSRLPQRCQDNLDHVIMYPQELHSRHLNGQASTPRPKPTPLSLQALLASAFASAMPTFQRPLCVARSLGANGTGNGARVECSECLRTARAKKDWSPNERNPPPPFPALPFVW